MCVCVCVCVCVYVCVCDGTAEYWLLYLHLYTCMIQSPTQGTVQQQREVFELASDEDRQCAVCNTCCFLSALRCPCSPGESQRIDRLGGRSDSCANSSSKIVCCTTELGAGLGTRLAERVESVSLIESA